MFACFVGVRFAAYLLRQWDPSSIYTVVWASLGLQLNSFVLNVTQSRFEQSEKQAASNRK